MLQRGRDTFLQAAGRIRERLYLLITDLFRTYKTGGRKASVGDVKEMRETADLT